LSYVIIRPQRSPIVKGGSESPSCGEGFGSKCALHPREPLHKTETHKKWALLMLVLIVFN